MELLQSFIRFDLKTYKQVSKTIILYIIKWLFNISIAKSVDTIWFVLLSSIQGVLVEKSFL